MANQQSIIGGLLKDAEKWKPQSYNAEIRKRRLYFTGHQTSYLRGKLSERFPQTGKDMSAYPVPLFRHLAAQRATIYNAKPMREIITADGSVDDDATSRAERLYASALAENRLQKVEQIAAAAGLAFVRVATDKDARRLVFQARWPDHVDVVPDPDWPTDLQKAYALIAEINSEEGVRSSSNDKRRFEIWARQPDGGWLMEIAVQDGSQLRPVMQQPARLLPWVAVPFEDLDSGSLFEMPDEDDVSVSDAISIMYTNLLYTIENQSFTQLWYSGPKPEQKLVGGPGRVWDAGEAGQFSSLTYQPQIASVKETADNLIGRWLALHSINPGSASAAPSYESGVALKVKNQPMLEARLGRIPLYREMEERGLWPIVRELAPVVGERFDASAELRFTAGDLSLPLDDEAEFRLSQGRVAANVSTWPKEMVRWRISSTLSDAETTYKENQDFNEANPVTVGIPFIRGAKEAPIMRVEEEGAEGDGDDDGEET